MSFQSKNVKKWIATVLILSIGLTQLPVVSTANAATTKDLNLTLADYNTALDGYTDLEKYANYSQMHQSDDVSTEIYQISAESYTQLVDMKVEVVENYEGIKGKSVLTQEQGAITYEVTIKTAGLYNMSLNYFPVEGKSSAIQRAIFIDGKLPFAEANNIEFDRIWGDLEKEIVQDNQGNDLKPSQIEIPKWLVGVVKDYQGYYTQPYAFYLESGTHTITFLSQREPMMLHSIELYHEKKLQTYVELQATYELNGYTATKNQLIVIEAEQATAKSSQMLYPVSDHSSPALTPYDAKSIRMNTIGGKNWRNAGQWMEWQVEVKEAGLYKIGLNVKQNFVRGIYTSRKLTVDGIVPFAEAESLPFKYEKDWRIQTLGDGENPYLLYLEPGQHILRLEVTLGDLSTVIREVETGVRSLNEIYRKILSITGTAPDQYRDYQIEASIPGLAAELKVERNRVDKIITDLESMAGKISDREAGLITLRDQLDVFILDLEKIPKRLGQFKQNIGSMGTWMIQAIEQPLQLDEVYVASPDTKLPKLKDSWLDKIAHEAKTLYYSFIIDYNAIGNVAETKDSKLITVWVGTGRDQANVMKSLIDQNFTKKTGINVNLMLVDMATLLPATLSGEGPDVAMQVGNDLPMNYGMRNAVADLSQFDGFEEVTKQFYESAMVPYEFNNKCYALPETQTFNMLFYRKDILKDLGITPPKTWDELKVDLSVLSKNQMGFGMLPSAYYTANSGMLPVSEAIFGIFLYQHKGVFYTPGATASALDEDAAINAFKDFTTYYTDYKLEREFDSVNRFRTGEMPLLLSDYTTYNTLQVSAPEIKGLWGFTSVPGTVQADGSIDASIPSQGSACVMLEKSEEKDLAWEFMKWWVSSDTQVKYGREMEGLMGSSARYPTANIEAFASLPWPVNDYKALSDQFNTVFGIPQVPGGYFTARHINNAFYDVVVNKDTEPREALMNYVRYINDEIQYKREEFGLPQ